ncbi:5-formyltetrahydrofolate cyclo-ligase [Tepidanaerobacter sp. GT38]|uniref:5-formyltetrahydrofolate cyclo-ligase n=1 Tax=Tepidanaerobacter sp. GT38 TaxID=2722793 RepID=UPI00351D5025
MAYKGCIKWRTKEISEKKIIEQRLSLLQKEVEQKSDTIMSTLFSTDYYKKAKVVMFYVDMRNEVMTKKAIIKALSEGKRVVVPRVKKGYGLLAIEIKSLDELKTGTFGVLEPPEREEVILEEIDLVVVPGVVFDKKGYRIGYGGGYYDRFLPKLRKDAKKIAVAFEMQMVDFIPAESHDIKMDAIITEKRLYGPFE